MNKSGKKKNRNILKGLQLFKTKKKIVRFITAYTHYDRARSCGQILENDLVEKAVLGYFVNGFWYFVFSYCTSINFILLHIEQTITKRTKRRFGQFRLSRLVARRFIYSIFVPGQVCQVSPLLYALYGSQLRSFPA